MSGRYKSEDIVHSLVVLLWSSRPFASFRFGCFACFDGFCLVVSMVSRVSPVSLACFGF